MLVFVKRGILIPAGNRCCSDHLYKHQLNSESLGQICADIPDQLVCDAGRLQEIINNFRLILENQKTFDFDDPYPLNNDDYYNITGLQKGSLNNKKITSYLKLSHACYRPI